MPPEFEAAGLPRVVNAEEWAEALAEVTVSEKALTRMGNLVSAKRRRLPMTTVSSGCRFEGTDGPKSLVELFDGRTQLIVHHFMFDPDWDAGCPGCSWVVDAMSNPPTCTPGTSSSSAATGPIWT